MAKVKTFACDLCHSHISNDNPMAGFKCVESCVQAVSVTSADIHLCKRCIVDIRKITDKDGQLGRVLA